MVVARSNLCRQRVLTSHFGVARPVISMIGLRRSGRRSADHDRGSLREHGQNRIDQGKWEVSRGHSRQRRDHLRAASDRFRTTDQPYGVRTQRNHPPRRSEAGLTGRMIPNLDLPRRVELIKNADLGRQAAWWIDRVILLMNGDAMSEQQGEGER